MMTSLSLISEIIEMEHRLPGNNVASEMCVPSASTHHGDALS